MADNTYQAFGEAAAKVAGCSPTVRRPVSRVMKPGTKPAKLTPGHTFQGSVTKTAEGPADTAKLVGLSLTALGLGTAGIHGTLGAVDAKPGHRGRGFARGAFGGIGTLGGAAVGALPALGVGALAGHATGSPVVGQLGAVGTGLASAMGGRYLANHAFDAMFPEQPEPQPKAAEWGATVASRLSRGMRTRGLEEVEAKTPEDRRRRLAEATS